MWEDLGFYWELYWPSITATLVAGLACPLVGAFLLVRRTAFYGVALPQLSACGVAFGYALLPWWVDAVGLQGLDYETAIESPHALTNYLLGWAAVYTFGGLGALALFSRAKETETARVATLFAVSAAATTLFAMRSPTGAETIDALLHGEILAVDVHELETLLVVLGLVLACLAVFAKDLVLVSYDPETARVLRKPVRAFEALLLLLVGLTVSMGTLLVGPVVLFGLIVLPPLAARSVANSMRSFLQVSGALGLLGGAGGLLVSFGMDWPLGPSIVTACAALLPPCWVWRRLRAAD